MPEIMQNGYRNYNSQFVFDYLKIWNVNFIGEFVFWIRLVRSINRLMFDFFFDMRETQRIVSNLKVGRL